MKNLINYLSKKSLSLDNGSRMTRKRLGIDSGMTRFSLASLICLCMLTVGSGNAWGGDATVTLDFEGSSGSWPYNSDWESNGSSNATNHTPSGSRSAGFGVNGSAYITYKNALTNIKCVTLYMNRTTNNTKNPTITIQKSTWNGSAWSDWTDITGASQKFALDKNKWTLKTFDFSAYKYNGKVRIKYTNNTTAVKLIDDIVITYEEASCDKKVTIVKGTPETGGSFNLDKTGAQDCCSALTVTVSNITAPSGKEFDAITQSGIATGVTINQSAKTVTYAANSTGTSTINVTFRDLPKYTVTLMDDGDTRTQASYEASVTLPARAGCAGYTFAGWTKSWVAPQSSWTATAPTIIPAGSYTPAADENLYPVYTKTEGGEEEETEIFATTSLGSTNTVTTGYAVSAAAEARSGYYQDGSGTTRSVSVRKSNTATAMISSIPTIATVTATLGGGTTKDPLTNNVYAVWLDASGNELGDAVQITSKITNTTGSDFTANLPVANATSAYGVRIKHQKETSYNVRYYAISLSITTGGSTTYYISVPACCTDPGLNYATGSVTKTYGEGAFTNTLTNSHSVGVTYESSNTDVATVASDGTVTIQGAGNATITARFAGNSTYCADEASYTLTINKANISPTLTYTPNSVAAGSNTSAPTVGGNTGGGGVTYAITSATPSGCATINTSTGVVTGVAVGSVTVTATVAATTNYNGGSATANVTITAASYFTNGATVFVQTGSVSSAWDESACVKAWFNASGAGGAAQTTYWLYDGTGDNNGKKLFATIVPATGDLNQVTLQRFASNCSDFWNNNGTLTKASDGGSNTFRTEGPGTSAVAWNASGVALYLYGDPNSWGSSLATFSDQLNGVWEATYNNYAPANAAGESQEFKIFTSYNDWIGNTGSNNNATLDGMHVGSTYNITATLDVKDHSLTMSKTFVKGTVHFNLQGHGLAISDLTNVAAGSKISAPSEPSATGWTFGGWFTDAECTDEWTFASDEVNETMTLYAKWTANVYTITKTLANVSNTGLPTSFTYTGATTTALNSTFTVDATNFFLPSSIAVTMGGTPLTAGTDYTYNNSTGAFTYDKIITGNIVITASATAKLKSIAITTPPTTRKYFAGESFSSTGAVVTATMGDGSTKTVSATWTPSGALSAGTSQTVTASYTENGITKTATTTIDVYSVTVNKKNEDGDAIDVAGVTATWTVGTKALAAGVGSTKYAFKEWQVTGATPASTTSASTTLSSPTANVVVNAVFYKPRVIKWSVNGNDSYATGEPTTTVAYNGTISAVPTAPADNTLSCTNKFMGWSTKDAGTTPKTTSYYDDLFTNASGYTTNITAATTTFYAVFAEAETGVWTLDYSEEEALRNSSSWGSYGTAYNYTASDGGTWTVKAYKNSGMQINTGKDASIKIPNCSGNITSIVITCSAAKAVGLSASDYTGSGITYIAYGTDATSQTIDCSSATATGGYIVPKSGSTSITKIVVNYGSASNYVTECDANMIRVTYDANGGSTTCENTTTNKTEDYTVCSTPPTRDYYTFAGWLCSADSKTYAASATIDDAVIDADFTLTAQWTPVTYTITYNYNGGSAQVDPVPATSYTVESSDITLQTPTKGHDRFDGWYENADLSTGGVKTTIAAGSHENKTYYAKWTARHEIIFDADGATTTIYRAEDEDLSASVAGQGSVPSDPSAPTACSTKVFVGWSESTIDGETDTEPGDLMKPAAGTVDEDKHYYAVWAIEESSSGTETIFTDDFNVTGTDEVTSRSGWTDLSTVYGGSGSIRFSSGKNAGSMTLDVSGMEMSGTWEIKFKIKKYGSDGSGALAVSSAFEDVTTSFSPTSVSTTDGANWTEKTITVTGVHSGTEIHFDGTANSRVYVKDVEIKRTGTITTHSAYSTSCCATKVTLSDPSITGTGATITFDKVTPVATCDGSKTVTATVTVTAGYQVTELSFSGGSVNVSPAISTPLTSSQNYTLTFAEGTNATLTSTATVSAKPLSSITLDPASAEVYVGQYAIFTVSYDPSDVLTKGYSFVNTPTYVTKRTDGVSLTGQLKLEGGRSTGPGASITETVVEIVSIQATADNSKTASVEMTVKPLPRVHFVDNVHGKEFADVVATISENTLNPNKTTKTSVDWSGSTANTCEEQHLHLVGWIDGDWAPYAAYMAGTGDMPDAVTITGATGYFYAPGADINVLTNNGKTFYAVWAEVK